jgi:hypothetical protein
MVVERDAEERVVGCERMAADRRGEGAADVEVAAEAVTGELAR